MSDFALLLTHSSNRSTIHIADIFYLWHTSVVLGSCMLSAFCLSLAIIWVPICSLALPPPHTVTQASFLPSTLIYDKRTQFWTVPCKIILFRHIAGFYAHVFSNIYSTNIPSFNFKTSSTLSAIDRSCVTTMTQ